MTADEWARLYGYADVEAFIVYVMSPRPVEHEPSLIAWDEWVVAA